MPLHESKKEEMTINIMYNNVLNSHVVDLDSEDQKQERMITENDKPDLYSNWLVADGMNNWLEVYNSNN